MIDKYASRRIGKTCKACGNRFASSAKANVKSVCDSCMQIFIPCPVCNNPMTKYKAKGGERVACCESCKGKLIKKTPEHIEKIRLARNAHYDKVGRKSHSNHLARLTPTYAEWRSAVYERDDYTCQDCGAHNERGVGKTIELHPHHIEPFATNPDLRYEVGNGVTLCKICHRKRHAHVFIGRVKRHKAPPSDQLNPPTVE